MRNLISFFAALVVLTVSAKAQDPLLSALPGDPNATLIAQMPIVTEVSVEFLGKKKENVQTEIMVWRTSAGGTAFTVSIASIAPTTGAEIDYIPTKEIFRQVSTNAVREGALRGFFPPVGTHTTKIWYQSNVERLGSGINTRFAACAMWEPVARDYSVSFNNGEPTVIDLTTTSYPNACGEMPGALN